MGIPSEAYLMREEVDVDGQLMKTFVQLPTSIEASLPEQIGVEFLLRDITDGSKSSIHKIVNFFLKNLSLFFSPPRLMIK